MVNLAVFVLERVIIMVICVYESHLRLRQKAVLGLVPRYWQHIVSCQIIGNIRAAKG